MLAPAGSGPVSFPEPPVNLANDIDYYERRAEDQIALAQRAVTPAAVQAHYQLAAAYLDRIYGDQQTSAEAA